MKRIGIPYTTAWAAAQKPMVYQAVTGTPMVQTPDNNSTGYEKFRQHFYIQDVVDERAVIPT